MAWRQALKRNEFKTEDEEKGRREIQFDATEMAFIEALLTFVAEESNPVPLSVAKALSILKTIRDGWTSAPALLAPLIRSVEEMARHCPVLSLELRQWTRLLAE